MRICLSGCGSVDGKRCTQITKTRHGNDAKAAPHKRLGEIHSLVKSTTRAMNDQDGWSIAGDRVLDRPAVCLDDSAASRDALACPVNVAAVGDKHECE